MELYFTKPENIGPAQAEFDAFESRHIIKTMRNKPGDPIHFTDGCGNLYNGRIIDLHPVLRVSYKTEKGGIWPPPFQSVLAVAAIRPARMDILIEKATELGITRFILFSSRYSNYPIKNSSRWEKITQQAIKQSNRLYLPEIKLVSGLKDVFTATSGFDLKLIARQEATQRFLELLLPWTAKKTGNIVVLIGPEGGFDQDELKFAEANAYAPINLGTYRLRAETAAISAASLIDILRN